MRADSAPIPPGSVVCQTDEIFYTGQITLHRFDVLLELPVEKQNPRIRIPDDVNKLIALESEIYGNHDGAYLA